MANYTPLSNETVTEFVTPTQTREVDQWGAQAVPSGIVFYARFTSVIDDPETIAVVLTDWADRLNQLSATPGVVSVLWVTDINDQDQYVDTLNITVDSTASSAIRTTLFNVPTSESVAQWQARVADARKFLDAVAAG